MNESFTVTAKLCCWCFNVSQETVTHQRLLTESKRGLFPPIIHSFIHIHRVVPKRLFSYPLTSLSPWTHHGNPSKGRHTLADSGEVVEQRRAAVLLPKRLHLLDHAGHGLQESRQNCLKSRKRTKV